MFVRVMPRVPPIRIAAVCAGMLALALLVRSWDAPRALVPLVALCALVPLVLWPQLAIFATLFLLYTNIPAIAHQLHGVPQLVAGSFLLLLGLPLAGALGLRRERVRTGTVFHFMLAYFGVLLFTMLFAREQGIAVARVLTYVVEGLLLFWLVVNVVRTERTLRRALWTVLLAGAFLGGLSLFQAATGGQDRRFAGLAQHSRRVEYVAAEVPGEAPRLQVYISERAGGPFGEPNRYAQILLVLVPIAAVFVRRARSHTARFVAATTLILLLAGVMLTYSRGGLLTLALLVAAGIRLRWLQPRHAVLATALMLLLAFHLTPGLGTRLASIGEAMDLVRDRPSIKADAAIRGRATEMLASLNVFLDHPFVGVGPGQYLPVYSVDYQQSLTTKFRDLHRPRRAHNLYLEIAAETGILGIIAFLAIMATLALQLRHARACWAERDPEYSDLATAFLLALGVYLASGLLLHLAFERYLWLLLALAAALLHTRQPELAYYTPPVRRLPTLAEVHRGLV